MSNINKEKFDAMYNAGAHYGFVRSKRHPSVTPYIFGNKNRVEIFDLEKTQPLLTKATDFIKDLASQGKMILFVSGKREAIRFIKEGAAKVDMPYVAGRWIGGTLTNFEQIQKRVSRLEKLTGEREKGLLAKYTKKERLLIDREIVKLEERFGGLLTMKKKPDAVFIVDTKQEEIAFAEAKKLGIPIIGLASSDCDISKVEYPIVANDTSVKSVEFVVNEILEAFEEGAKNKTTETPKKD